MTGWRWAGECLDWTVRPDLYSAIHFHGDDMSDAGWETDFSFSVPVDLPSGVYSVRLVPDGDDAAAYHCVLAIRPPRHRPSVNRVCLLLPTASYLAYANHRLGLDVPGTEIGMGRLVEIDRHHVFLQEHPELGFSFYEVHADGSGVFYSSRNRPIVDLQPGVKGFLGGLDRTCGSSPPIPISPDGWRTPALPTMSSPTRTFIEKAYHCLGAMASSSPVLTLSITRCRCWTPCRASSIAAAG